LRKKLWFGTSGSGWCRACMFTGTAFHMSVVVLCLNLREISTTLQTTTTSSFLHVVYWRAYKHNQTFFLSTVFSYVFFFFFSCLLELYKYLPTFHLLIDTRNEILNLTIVNLPLFSNPCCFHIFYITVDNWATLFVLQRLLLS
jgi:hypothetical protein